MKKIFWISLGLLFVVGAINSGNKPATDSMPQTSAGSQQAPSSVASTYMDSINQKVIDDAEQEYQIANQGGSDTDRCVAAGMVAAAYQQAHEQSGYNRWKMREDSDCHSP